MNSNLKLSVEKLVLLHKFFLEGKGESEEADRVRDEMEPLHHFLSEEDQKWLRSISAKLYEMTDD